MSSGDFRTQARGIVIEEWNKDVSISDTAYTVVYQHGSGAVLHSLLWEVDSDKITVKVEIDGAVVFDLSLKDLEKDYALDSDDFVGNPGVPLEYKAECWVWTPREPVEYVSQLQVSMMASSGDRKLKRGLTARRAR